VVPLVVGPDPLVTTNATHISIATHSVWGNFLGGDGERARIDSDALGGVVGLVDSHQPVGQLEHVVAQRDDDELRVARALLDVVAHDGHVAEVERSCE